MPVFTNSIDSNFNIIFFVIHPVFYGNKLIAKTTTNLDGARNIPVHIYLRSALAK